jgi:hypothetical protein
MKNNKTILGIVSNLDSRLLATTAPFTPSVDNGIDDISVQTNADLVSDVFGNFVSPKKYCQ